MRLNEVKQPVITNDSAYYSQKLEDYFQDIQSTGFSYFSITIHQTEEEIPDDELIELHRDVIEEFMQQDDYKNIEVIRLKNYSRETGASLYKTCRDPFETRLITHGQCSLFVEIHKKTFEFTCRRGDVIRLPAELNYWFEVGFHECRYIHLYMTESGWDNPAERLNPDKSPGPVNGIRTG